MSVATIPHDNTAASRASLGPALSVRRFGWTDFENFDVARAKGPHLSVGSASIGKVEVDCRYRWRESQWGVLGSNKYPAGIVYMDLSFNQPSGYRLHSASVFITLSEDPASARLELPVLRPRHRRRPSLNSEYAVQMSGYYGPRFLSGAPVTVNYTKTKSAIPTLGAMGFEIGGTGVSTQTEQQHLGRWTFKGMIKKAKAGHGLRTLEWELAESPLDKQPVHSQVYHTAFAFEHSERPVFMRVEVQGRLKSTSHQLKYNMLRFSTRSGHKDNSSVTQIHFQGPDQFSKRLDEIAHSLDMTMQEKNLEATVVEMPNPTPVTFASVPSTNIERMSPLVQESIADVSSVGDHTAPTIENLLRPLQSVAVGRTQLLDELEAEHEPPQVPRSVPNTNTPATPPTTPQVESRDSENSQPTEDQLRMLVQFPPLLALLRLLALLMRYLGRGTEQPLVTKSDVRILNNIASAQNTKDDSYGGSTSSSLTPLSSADNIQRRIEFGGHETPPWKSATPSRGRERLIVKTQSRDA